MYFAESEPVARSYRRQLAQSDPNASFVIQRAEDELLATSGDAQRAIANLRREAENYFDDPWMARRIRGAAHAIENGAARTPGHMYEVNIHARPEQFLDWDRPLSQQGTPVRSYFEPRRRDIDQYMVGNLNDPHDWTGDALLHYLAQHSGGRSGASNVLNAAGIPGIRYLDAGSRGSGTGTSNYVLFNPEIVEILRRYGIAAPVTGAGVAGALSDRQNP
jgi:hypothetical protein